jgi:hypothetical protein
VAPARAHQGIDVAAAMDPVNNFKEEIIDHQVFFLLVNGDVQLAEGDGARLHHDGSDGDQESGPS